jgi:hypothetical protein
MCNSCSRRSFVVGATAALLAAPGLSFAADQKRLSPCGFNQADFDKYRASMSSMPKGDSSFHPALVGELENILKIFRINPGFQYVDARNAFAIPDTLIPGTNGTVLIGVSLVRELLQPQDGGLSVAGVLAHECGHIFQYTSQYRTQLGSTQRLMELQADLLAGYYMGRKTGLQPGKISVFSRTLIQGGTYSMGGTNDHGTPGQRNAAMDKGFMLALNGKTFLQTASEGAEYVGVL